MNARAGEMANDVPHPSSMNDEIASSVSDGEDASMWIIFFLFLMKPNGLVSF